MASRFGGAKQTINKKNLGLSLSRVIFVFVNKKDYGERCGCGGGGVLRERTVC
jgi:hypothetical protein